MSINLFSLSWLGKALPVIAAMAALVDPLAARAAQITERIDEARLTRLQGNSRHDLDTAEDQGALQETQRLPNLRLILKRSASQELALTRLMTEQLDPASAHFHRWLTPAEFGAYGPSDTDIQTLTQWLQGHGFTVEGANIGRTFLRFSGSAAAVKATFHTELHRYLVHGEPHIANSVDPSIPSALNAIVGGVHLSDFRAKPLHHHIGAVDLARKIGRSMPENSVSTHPLNDPAGTGYKLVAPYDFAAIYNVLPLWNAGIDGTGQSIAIAGRSDISLADVAAFRSAFGLPPNVPTIIVNGADPGIPTAGDKVENSLDVEWSGAIAKNAQIIFVKTASTTMSDGAADSAQYIIDNRIAPVMSFSYGLCELQLGAEGNYSYNLMWQQAAMEGISVFVAAGDSGSAACDDGAAAPGATHGLAVSGTSSTPYNTAVGGTDFNWANLPNTTYWSGSNDATGASAPGYIPEVPWNSTCASVAIDQIYGFAGAGYDPEQTCQYLLNNNYTDLVSVTGGGGGPSNCTTGSSGTMQSCAGGYAKPSWQSGVGVPADGHRDVPDVSLFAANGALDTAYVICDSDSGPCDYAAANDEFAQAVGGTSVASPAMAGIMALVNQKMGSAQGNANAVLYALAALDDRPSCASGTVASGNSCNFYDIVSDDNAVPCAPGSFNCVVHHNGDTVGILSGYTATAGYDLATGLGSINANNLVNNWHLAAVASTVSVPNVTGLTAAGAVSVLNAAGLTLGSVATQSSNTVASGLVLAESPAATTVVTRNSTVNLTLSSGPAPVTVPALVGLTQAAAIASIMNASLVIGPVTTVASATIPAGVVMLQSPVAGSRIAAASAVSLLVSSGPIKTVVPAVVGLSQTTATGVLAAALLDVGTIGTQSSATVPAGFVLAEAPAAGTSLAISSAVNLLVSTGPAPVAVPNVVGDRQSVATLAITSAKLAVGTIASTSSATVPAGEIISQSPAAGTTLKVGGSVNLSVSSGAALVPVPSVIGLTQAAAGADLSKAGLSMGTVTSQASATVAAGKILGQSPAAGAKVAKASKVNLAISTGPVLVVTPKVVGLTEAKAKAVLQNAGETLGAVTTAANPLPAGEVISQSPLANAKAARGSAVRVVISTGK